MKKGMSPINIFPFLLALVMVITLQMTVCTFVRVSGESMAPTLESGDLILAVRVYNTKNLKPDQLVIFQSETGRFLVKRIAAVPGESIHGVDGIPDLTLGEDQYYVLGDNRDHSRDSRSFGPICGKQIQYVYAGFHLSELGGFVLIGVVGLSVSVLVCRSRKKEAVQ